MKKLFLSLLIFVLSGCSNIAEEERWESYDFIPITDVQVDYEDVSCVSDCDYSIRTDLVETDLSDIHLGLSRTEILEKIGRRHSMYGSGFWIELYVLDDSTALFYYVVENDVVVLDELVVCSTTECKKLK